MRYAISYVSTANPELTKNQIQTTLDYSKNWNNNHVITGILLFSQGNFFQVLEGEENLLKELFERIKADKRHHNIITIFQKEVSEVKFDNYEADFISLDDRYHTNDIDSYFSQIRLLNPSIQSSVKYILNKFTEGIK
ncbi:hypothetical protein GCM10007103_05840 [Salinimicrobium marinum]|uniref:BLUF domain-containing protein n=1 Tax=Salinimicrobium marinum TaxID=680283 RepID=A0A918S7K5_9FLAO|nr:BLUF domain-containing protein [Salinimicrobium marinum]GHA27282.1 hypothetical protein GCM10007103_05840 [Salinimicrobium marinum]